MPIETNFKFGQVVTPPAGLAPGLAPPPDPRGLLAGFVGNLPLALPGQDNPLRSWSGQGFNMIWRPNFGGQSGAKDFFLELNLTQETLSFTDITGSGQNIGIANRGALQPDILLGGIAYLQQVTDRISGVGQHFEPGVWINVPSTTNPPAPASVSRMGSIPHGTTINLEGVVFTAPAPFIADTTITPFSVGSPDDGATGLVTPLFPEQTLANVTTSRTPPASVPGLTQDILTNPNLLLKNAIVGQNIINTTVLIVASDPTLLPVARRAAAGSCRGRGRHRRHRFPIGRSVHGIQCERPVDNSDLLDRNRAERGRHSVPSTAIYAARSSCFQWSGLAPRLSRDPDLKRSSGGALLRLSSAATSGAASGDLRQAANFSGSGDFAASGRRTGR